MTSKTDATSIFARRNVISPLLSRVATFAILTADGMPVTTLDADVWPVGSDLGARYCHPNGIDLTRADVIKAGIEFEDEGEATRVDTPGTAPHTWDGLADAYRATGRNDERWALYQAMMELAACKVDEDADYEAMVQEFMSDRGLTLPREGGWGA